VRLEVPVALALWARVMSGSALATERIAGVPERGGRSITTTASVEYATGSGLLVGETEEPSNVGC